MSDEQIKLMSEWVAIMSREMQDVLYLNVRPNSAEKLCDITGKLLESISSYSLDTPPKINERNVDNITATCETRIR